MTSQTSLKPQSLKECCMCCCAPAGYCAYARSGMRKVAVGQAAAAAEGKAAATQATVQAPQPQRMSSPNTKPVSKTFDLESIDLEECIKRGQKKTRLDAPALEDLLRKIVAKHEKQEKGSGIQALLTMWWIQRKAFTELTTKINWFYFTFQQRRLICAFLATSNAILEARARGKSGKKEDAGQGLAGKAQKKQKEKEEEEEEEEKEEEEQGDTNEDDSGNQDYDVDGITLPGVEGIQDQVEPMINEILTQMLEGACDYVTEILLDLSCATLATVIGPCQEPAKLALKIPLKLYRLGKTIQKMMNPTKPKKEDFLPKDQYKAYCLKKAREEEEPEAQIAALLLRAHFFHSLTVLSVMTMDSIEKGQGSLKAKQFFALHHSKFFRFPGCCGPETELRAYAKATEERIGQRVSWCSCRCCYVNPMALACEDKVMIMKQVYKKGQQVKKTASKLLAAPSMQTMKDVYEAGKDLADETAGVREELQGMSLEIVDALEADETAETREEAEEEQEESSSS